MNLSKYKFNRYPTGTCTIQYGTETIEIADGIGQVDPANADQVALAKAHGGVAQEPEPEPKPKPRRRAKKTDGDA